MEKNLGPINIKFGWIWLFLGILLAMILGLYAFQSDWLGGYTSLTRRFIRLGHIAFIATALVNILYGLSIDTIKLPHRIKTIGSYSMIIAAVTMPTICILAAINQFFQTIFFIPALAFALAIFIMALGQLKRTEQ